MDTPEYEDTSQPFNPDRKNSLPILYDRGQGDRRGPNPAHQLLTSKDASGKTFTDEGRRRRMDIFLDAYRRYGTVRAGCVAAGIGRSTYLSWMSTSPYFINGMSDARADYEDRLREEINRRAVEGNVEIKRVYHRGEMIDEYPERKYSDLLLIFQAKARMPEYRDKQEEEKGTKEVTWEQAAALLADLDKSTPGVAPGPPPAPDYAVPGSSVVDLDPNEYTINGNE